MERSRREPLSANSCTTQTCNDVVEEGSASVQNEQPNAAKKEQQMESIALQRRVGRIAYSIAHLLVRLTDCLVCQAD